ncbi:MAG: ribosome biogenesis GTPase Der [Planctomycetota bacterium]|jgi:GTP-binding protein
MALARITIVGRPNVGKSCLLNRLAGRRVSIVEPTAGVTRDRVAVTMDWRDRRFEIIDTGGLGLVDDALLKEHIEAQIEIAVELSDQILFVVDGKEGLVPGDEMVAQRLRRKAERVLLVVNKVESRWEEYSVSEWEKLGYGEPLPVSALEGYGASDLLDRVVQRLPPKDELAEEVEDEVLRFAVVGKRNSGKSTLINRLVGEERVIVSEVPGTTRDAVDVEFEHDDKRLVAIDTAGVRKKRSMEDAIEFFSYTRSLQSIRRADVVLHLFDITGEISQVDKKLATYCVDQSKPVILVGNKADLAEEIALQKWDSYIRQQLAGLSFAPVSFISALDGFNVDETLDLLFEMRAQATTEIPTARLNEALQSAKEKLSPKSHGQVPKLFYATQVGVQPLQIMIFVNEPKLFRGQYERYLQNVLRDSFECPEVPIRLVFRKRAKVKLEPL